MPRADGRKKDALRTLEFTRGYTRNAQGSVLTRMGETVVLCTACWEKEVPDWKRGQGTGWLTAEYDMLPASTHTRRRRSRTKMDGRTYEIQRLVGRSLRAVVDLAVLGENSILVDCDVLQADGGTRTASINGAYVAVCDAVSVAIKQGWLTRSPVREPVGAISVGRVDGAFLLDLDYSEDVAAEVDLNVVMAGSDQFVEVQGTGEEATFTHAELDQMLRLARKGITQVFQAQAQALGRRTRRATAARVK